LDCARIALEHATVSHLKEEKLMEPQNELKALIEVFGSDQPQSSCG
jgi:hypothetical protein